METAVRHSRPADRENRVTRPSSHRRVSKRRSADSRSGSKQGRFNPAPAVSTLQFFVYMVIAVVGITLYVGHVQATDALMAETQGARQENLHLHLMRNHLKGDFDRMTGPSVVIDRARKLGLVEGYRYGQPIVIAPSE